MEGDKGSKYSPGWKGVITVIGAFMCNLVAGNLNNWGTISPYITSWLHSMDPEVNSSHLFIVFPIGYIFEGLGIFASPYLADWIGFRWTLVSGMLFYCLTVLICVLIPTPLVFTIAYGIGAGWAAGIGGATAAPTGQQWYPKKLGMIAGLSMAAFNFGPVLFGIVLSTIANPDNVPASVIVPRGKEYDHLFDERVYARTELTLIVLIVSCAVLTIIGGLLIQERPKHEIRGSDSPRSEYFPMKKLLASKNFWYLWAAFFFAFMYWAYIMNVYKTFGLANIDDDKFLSWLGSLGNIIGTASRFIFGTFMDFLSFKTAYGMITIFALANSVTIYFIAANKWLYVIWIGLMYFMGCGIFVTINVQCTKSYGYEFGGKVFGPVATGMALSTFLTMPVEWFILEVTYKQPFGFMVTFFFFGVINIFAIISAFLVSSDKVDLLDRDLTTKLVQ